MTPPAADAGAGALWLVRHARPLVDEGVCYGRLDLPADAAHTAEAAAALAVRLPPGIALRCSPLARCRQLASALCRLRPDLRPVADPRLAEMDFGAWEGRRWDTLGADALAAWTADFAHHAPGGGETVAGVMARVAEAMAESGTGPAAWITHAGVIRAARLIARGVAEVHDAGQWPPNALPFGGLVVLSVPPASRRPAPACRR